MTANAAPITDVTIVTQTRVASDKNAEFSAWQQRISDKIAGYPGFIDHQVIPPAPPSQDDWVIIQRFRSLEDARNWFQSGDRQELLGEIAPILVGADDVHFFAGGHAGAPPASVSAVISTRVAPEQTQRFREWERRIAATETEYPGFLGMRLEPPIPGVQEDWGTVVRFDTNEHLQSWLSSKQREGLLNEAEEFGADFHVRTVQSGFAGWFNFDEQVAGAVPPAWKESLVVLLVLYPVVFLFGYWVQTPYLVHKGMPFWLALFLGNLFSVFMTGLVLIPQGNRLLLWWLVPRKGAPAWTNAAGIALVLAIYGLYLAIFSRFP